MKAVALKDFVVETARSLGFTGYDMFLYKAAIGWLAEEGYLALREGAEGGSERQYITTPKGRTSGLQETEPQEEGGVTILCNERFQGFLLASMDKILAFERRQWEPFLNCLTPEWCAGARACCQRKEISLTALLRQVGSQLPPDIPRKPNAVSVNLWLAQKGIVERAVAGSQKVYWPTYEGRKLGLSLSRNNVTIYWSFASQQFLVDNLEAIARDLASGEVYRLGPGPRRLTGVQAALAQIEVAAQERSLSELNAMVNQALAQLKDGDYKLPNGVIWRWLFRKEYIKVGKTSGTVKPDWTLTDAGRAAGFGRSENGNLVAGEAGQRFVVAHMEEIWDLYLDLLKKQ